MTHLSDECLLMLQDGELVGNEAAKAKKHLCACAQCNDRLEVVRLLTCELETLQQPAEASRPDLRVRLQQGLEESSASIQTVWWRRSFSAIFLKPTTLIWVGTMGALLLLTIVGGETHFFLKHQDLKYAEAGTEPNPILTPGSTSPVELSEVCSRNDHDLNPTVSPEKKRAVFAAYGISVTAEKAYQVDYLINPQLGGSDALDNLWPEPYHASLWNADVKDTLEKKLHGLVCSHRLELKEAQRDLASDWIGAYKRYFHASYPTSTSTAQVEFRKPRISLRWRQLRPHTTARTL